MMKKVHFVLFLGALLSALNLMYLPATKNNQLLAQTYLGPKEFGPKNAELIRVEILVKDSPDLSGLQIQNVSFNGVQIPLKPRDIFGKRGDASFQLPPGKYILRWTANRDTIVWPRVLRFEEEVNLDLRDLWVQVQIIGDQATIR